MPRGYDGRDRGLRLVSVILPLSEQRELVRRPVGPAGWHGRWVAFLRRKCSKHLVSIVRIRHEGVIVQLYAVLSHVRNIHIAKEWPDITRKRNLRHRFSSRHETRNAKFVNKTLRQNCICIVAYLIHPR